MKIMGLDVSSHSTGYSVIEAISDNIKIVGYGLIRCDSSMGPTQRLYFQGNELKKQIEKYCPDNIGIEETILVRGPKIMRTLARFSGVAIYLSYSYQKKEIFVFEPSMWKKVLGIGGNATKAEVQLEICSKFSILSQKQIDVYKGVFESIEESVANLKITAKQQKMQKKELNKKIKEIEKMYDKISTDIYSDCGINSDIADSFGVSLAVLNEIR